MRIYVINLDRDTEKLAFMDEQLRRLGLSYTRIPGVYGKDLSGNQRAAQVNAFRWWCAIGRPVVPAEIGVALSHASIYGKIPVGEAACVFEDDVLIDEAFPARLTEVEKALKDQATDILQMTDKAMQKVDETNLTLGNTKEELAGALAEFKSEAGAITQQIDKATKKMAITKDNPIIDFLLKDFVLFIIFMIAKTTMAIRTTVFR